VGTSPCSSPSLRTESRSLYRGVSLSQESLGFCHRCGFSLPGLSVLTATAVGILASALIIVLDFGGLVECGVVTIVIVFLVNWLR